ncbi:MAG: hypothetical protein A2948_04160 [Candidatus Lloydbacteria bacterium RIFCSPLOWO2_01_FULL_54_18]|nr:MAG: hypothetical protein A2948_04160 [Candidatus Lloydbacteria bacterium RIFCSPLOWO2_01_FULL_54_18]
MICWQRSRELVREVYKALANCRDNGFRDQIQRAAVSVMSNIAEGFESGTKQEFLNYLYIAKASAGEVRAQTYVASDVGYIDISTFKHLNNLAEQCSRLIASFTAKLKTGGLAGEQRRPGRSREEVILEEIMEERGYVMTPQGVKKKTDI